MSFIPKLRRADLALANPEAVKGTVFGIFNALQGEPKRVNRVVALAAALLIYCHRDDIDPRGALETAFNFLFDADRHQRPEWKAVHQYVSEQGDH